MSRRWRHYRKPHQVWGLWSDFRFEGPEDYSDIPPPLEHYRGRDRERLTCAQMASASEGAVADLRQRNVLELWPDEILGSE